MATSDSKFISLDDLTKELTRLFSDDKVNIDVVKNTMESYKSRDIDLHRYAKFDPHRYTRNLVDEGNGKFNLIVLCWGEGQGSGIHNHSDSHCFMKVLKGNLKETMFAWPDSDDDDQEMTTTAVNIYKKDQVAYINDSYGLHRIENESNTEPAISLHLYSPAYDMCECFDQRTGHKRTTRITFWSKYGERPNKGNSGVEEGSFCCADPENN